MERILLSKIWEILEISRGDKRDLEQMNYGVFKKKKKRCIIFFDLPQLQEH